MPNGRPENPEKVIDQQRQLFQQLAEQTGMSPLQIQLLLKQSPAVSMQSVYPSDLPGLVSRSGSAVSPEKQSSLDLDERTEIRKQALSQLEKEAQQKEPQGFASGDVSTDVFSGNSSFGSNRSDKMTGGQKGSLTEGEKERMIEFLRGPGIAESDAFDQLKRFQRRMARPRRSRSRPGFPSNWTTPLNRSRRRWGRQNTPSPMSPGLGQQYTPSLLLPGQTRQFPTIYASRR